MEKEVEINIGQEASVVVNIEVFKAIKNVVNIRVNEEVTKYKALKMGDCYLLVPEKLIIDK